ncbi:MAG: hypothetical protein ACPG66_03985 [Flavobacteriales bacterium]
MRIFPLFLGVCVSAFWTSSVEGQTVPCACMDGSSDGLVSNTDFLPFIMNWVWGDSIPEPEEMGPGLCDPDGDGTSNVHDLILFTSQQQQYCEGALGGALTLLDTAESTFQGWVLELVLEHDGLYMSIPEGAQTYRLYADFAPVPDADLHMMGLWGDADSPWYLEAPGGLYVSDFAGGDENTLPKQSLINTVFFSFFPELEYSSFWTTADMWSDSSVFGIPSSFERLQEGQREAFQSGDWSSEDDGGSCMLSVGGSVWHERMVVDGLHLVGQFTVLEGEAFSGQAGLALCVRPEGENVFTQLMVVPGSPYSLSDLEVLGCMDQEAINYDVSATYDNGTCEYCAAGDADCDGVVSVADLLDLLGMFGCTGNCGWADLDGDGTVGASDILAWLALVMG